jgi:hypothetical protein
VDVRGTFRGPQINRKTLLQPDIKSLGNIKSKIPFGIRFGNVAGNFVFSHNELDSLEGIPEKVDGFFDCSYNELASLEGVTQTVGGGFDCSNNNIVSLEEAPRTINGNFYCYFNNLTSLKGAPETIKGNFYFHGNDELESLEGAPLHITGRVVGNNLKIDKGQWNFPGWLEILTKGEPADQKLMKTLPYLQPEWLNSELQRDPGKMVHMLATNWINVPEDLKSKIKIPLGYEDEFGLFSGFDELGLF